MEVAAYQAEVAWSSWAPDLTSITRAHVNASKTIEYDNLGQRLSLNIRPWHV